MIEGKKGMESKKWQVFPTILGSNFLGFQMIFKEKKLAVFFLFPMRAEGGGVSKLYFVFTPSMRDKNTTFVTS